MSTLEKFSMSRRQLLLSSGIVVAFSLAGRALAQDAVAASQPALPDDMKPFPYLDSWIALDAKGHATIFTGKAELGQGVMTALMQVGAEELDLPPAKVSIVTADTARTPDEGLTAASHSMQYGGPAIRNAAANVRMILLREAASLLNVDQSQLTTQGDGTILARDGRRIRYGDIAAKLSLHVEAIASPPLRDTAEFRTMGKDIPRLDIPAKVTGGEAFVQDLRLPGMLHARILRGPSDGTILKLPPRHEVEAMHGVYKFVQSGSFAAVVCEKEWDAIRVMRTLEAAAFDRKSPPIPMGEIGQMLKAQPSRDYVILDVTTPAPDAIKKRSGRFTRPFYSHGSIGPSCAVAWMNNDFLTIWSHSQGIFDVRRVAANLLGLPIDKIRAIQSQGAGCYGQNGADDVAAEAAYIAAQIPGRPIRLQWMREQEFGFEPLGAAMVTEVEAGLDAENRIAAWKFDVWSPPHNTRPTAAGGTLIGTDIEKPFTAPPAEPIPMPDGDGSRNSNPLYALPNMNVNFHFIPDSPLRTSALRSLGGHLNVFSIESMFDELALAGALDPLDLRLNHMDDKRALAVMTAGAKAFGWRDRKREGRFHGFGMGFARYKNLGAYCAMFLEIRVDPDTGIITIVRAQAAVDCGEIVNPDGVRNQIEGGIIQSLSWCTQEEITYDAQRRTSFDWSTYPILRFSDVPLKIDVTILPRPADPFLGVAEASQGPASAAVANALKDATGVRFFDMPLSPAKVRAAIVTL